MTAKKVGTYPARLFWQPLPPQGSAGSGAPASMQVRQHRRRRSPPLIIKARCGRRASIGASITPPYHQGPMQARQHRCRVLVLWVFSRVRCVILFSGSVVTRPGNGGVFRKLLQDRCRHFWQSRGICPNALIQHRRRPSRFASREHAGRPPQLGDRHATLSTTQSKPSDLPNSSSSATPRPNLLNEQGGLPAEPSEPTGRFATEGFRVAAIEEALPRGLRKAAAPLGAPP